MPFLANSIMWLLNIHSRKLEYFDAKPPPYVILSHRWLDEEVTFQDILSDKASDKKGYAKVRGFCQKVAEVYSNKNDVRYAWIDTCCIDKTNSTELSEAINSMFRWYKESQACYVYLADVQVTEAGAPDFEHSIWFTRGWTLQELLAPSTILFFDFMWVSLGDTSVLIDTIARITSIPSDLLNKKTSIDRYSIAQRMAWASRRKTQRKEDIAYSLLGIFNVNMPLIYGEGDGAFQRLQEEILRNFDDLSIFAFRGKALSRFTWLAESPASFTFEGDPPCALSAFKPGKDVNFDTQGVTLTSMGINILLALSPVFLDTYLVPVCRYGQLYNSPVGCICISRGHCDGVFFKASFENSGLDEKFLLPNYPYGSNHDLRRVTLSKHSVTGNSWYKSVHDFYGFTVQRISPSVFKTISLEQQNSDKDTRRVKVFSRYRIFAQSARMAMRYGHVGLAGMLQFSVHRGERELHRTYLVFGFDFDFNVLCLAIRWMINDPPSKMPTIADFNRLAGRIQPLQIESDREILELIEMLRDSKEQSRTLHGHGVELHIIACLPYSGEQRTFSISKTASVRLTRNPQGYDIAIEEYKAFNGSSPNSSAGEKPWWSTQFDWNHE